MRTPVARPSRSATPSVAAVIPTWNEARNLEHLLPELPALDEVVIVDGRSEDDTVETALRLMPTATVLQQSRRGKGNALACGFEAARSDIIVMIDADGSADPAEIEHFVAALRAGADFAKGSRELGGSSDITRLRHLGNRGLTLLTNLMFRTRYTDLCYGYNAFWRDILPLLELPATRPTGEHMVWGDGFEIETLLNCRVARAGLKIAEVASHERERVHGVSNLSAHKDGLRVLTTILTEYRRVGAQPHSEVVEEAQDELALVTERPRSSEDVDLTTPEAGSRQVNVAAAEQDAGPTSLIVSRD